MTEHNVQSGDRLLWLAAGVVVLMGLTWLIVDASWSTPEPEALDDLGLAGRENADAAVENPVRSVAAASTASDPLRMAQMALDAGMLVEPAEYSAWTLFGRIAASESDNAEAREGLEQVAAALMRRGNAALEQGRYDDASEIVETITAHLPEHADALSLSAEITIATTTTPPEPVEPEPAIVAEAPEPIDPIPGMHAAFREAMVQNAVLRPAGSSAVDIVGEMLSLAPDHELTSAARDMLVTEMLDRSLQSIEALDAEAAQTWIDSAAPLAADPNRITAAQDRLTQHLMDTETQRVLPASELKTVYTAAPEFPRIPLERGIEGWVEIEFVVSSDGTTDDIQIIDASHERYFREEAVAAVGEWRFEPVIFMNRPIAKRTYTRLEFVLD